MTEQIHAIGSIWADASSRSLATLGTRLTNDSRFFDKMATGGTCTTKTLEKFLSFFRDATNWPDDRIPTAAIALLDNFENIAHSPAGGDDGQVHPAADTPTEEANQSGKSEGVTAQAEHAVSDGDAIPPSGASAGEALSLACRGAA